MPLLRLPALATLVLLAVAPAQADAQGRSTPAREKGQEQKQARPTTSDTSVSIPSNMMPPAGKCRIWMRGVPAAQQPAPTDCTTALRQAPANGVLVFGPALRDLSPFEARNPWTAASSEVTRNRARGRGDSSAGAPDRRSAEGAKPPAREAAPTTRRAPTTREVAPATRTAPAAREAPPQRRPDPPPPPPKKKPE